jgi:hypothetical protein
MRKTTDTFAHRRTFEQGWIRASPLLLTAIATLSFLSNYRVFKELLENPNARVD